MCSITDTSTLEAGANQNIQTSHCMTSATQWQLYNKHIWLGISKLALYN